MTPTLVSPSPRLPHSVCDPSFPSIIQKIFSLLAYQVSFNVRLIWKQVDRINPIGDGDRCDGHTALSQTQDAGY